jgi:peptidoglycan/xylan/chitin deacetylase (PgdA/CDA1 family)
MCGRCVWREVSRRGFCRAMAGGTAGMSIAAAGHAAARAGYAPAGYEIERDAPVEPRIRLADVPPEQRVIALTFDCCPGAFDARIATVLVAERIPSTIFITWLWMRRNPEGLALLLAHPDLFAIENHGELHIPPVLGDRAIFGIRVAGDLPGIRREVENGARAIRTATGAAPRWYRAATGFYTPSVIPEIEAMGFAIGGYSFSADLGASLPAARVAARMANARSGDVIVAHLNQPLRPSGLGVVEGLRALQRQGTTFVRLDQVATTQPASA